LDTVDGNADVTVRSRVRNSAEVALNRKTAATLSLTIPDNVLAQANKVID
jgi:ABC-type uncharacterized transport system substrate-binding protein